MASKLLKFYDLIKQEGGLQAQMRLAVITSLPSTKAADAPDSPENLAKFKAAYKEITGKEPPIV